MADDILKNIPLPADLPENWTSGQTVAPTGAEVGMDEQHGYNYLMRQVNNAQKALKALAAQREEDLARIKFWVSDDPTSPASFIGGTWEQIKDCFILAAGDTYAAGSTGGEAKHSLTKLENGPHSHEVVALGNDKWYYKTSNPVGIKFQTQYHTLINDISIVDTADESAGYLATNSSGTGQPHNNMPPYTATYIWRRVE
jgi:hypothetical protein